MEGPVNYYSYLVKKRSFRLSNRTPDPRLRDPRFWKVLFGRSFGDPRFWKVLLIDPRFWKVLLEGPLRPPILEGPFLTFTSASTAPKCGFLRGETTDLGAHFGVPYPQLTRYPQLTPLCFGQIGPEGGGSVEVKYPDTFS